MKKRILGTKDITTVYEVQGFPSNSIYVFDSEKKAKIFEDLLRYNTGVLIILSTKYSKEEYAKEICDNLAAYVEDKIDKLDEIIY